MQLPALRQAIYQGSKTMRITYLGHASLAVETEDLFLLCDPVLDDPHFEGVFDVYPKRAVTLDLLPKPTHVFVSHQHADHFDVRSLALLPRQVTVLCPQDDLITDALAGMGFKDVQALDDWSTFKVGKTTLVATPSQLKVPELGLLVDTGTALFWNQVDTAVDDTTITRVGQMYGCVDLLLAPWQPLLETPLQYYRPLQFPLRNYGQMLARIAQVRASHIALGANGTQFIGQASWQNNVCFPVTMERAIDDLATLTSADAAEIFMPQPGDVSILQGGETKHLTRAACFVSRSHDWNSSEFEFDPCMTRQVGKGALFAGNLGSRHISSIASAYEEILRVALREDSSLRNAYAEWKVLHQLHVFSEDGTRESLLTQFPPSNDLAVTVGTSGVANMTSYISAQAFLDFLDGTGSWDRTVQLGAYRHHESVLMPTLEGGRVPKRGVLHDPLWIAFPYFETLKRRTEAQVATLS